MNPFRSLCILPLLAMAQQVSAAAVTAPAASVAGSAPITVALPSAYGALIWAPLLLVFFGCAVALFVLIVRQGRTPVARPSVRPIPHYARPRMTRTPALARQ